MSNLILQRPLVTCQNNYKATVHTIICFTQTIYSILVLFDIDRLFGTKASIPGIFHTIIVVRVLFGLNYKSHVHDDICDTISTYIFTFTSYVYILIVSIYHIDTTSIVLASFTFISLSLFTIVIVYDKHRYISYEQFRSSSETYPIITPIPVVIEMDAR